MSMSMGLREPSQAFEWVQAPWGRAMRSPAIATPHLFTTRDLPLRATSGQPASGWDRLAAALGVARGRLLHPNQVHGQAIVVVSSEADVADACAASADIIMTARTDAAVAVQCADCVPLLYMDRRTGAVAAAHAGWRGTAAGVAAAAVRAMGQHFGTRADDLAVAIGPSIGPCCYQVGSELLTAFGPDGHRWFARLGDRLLLNLWNANRDQLVEAGVQPSTINVSGLCTAMHADLFDSYRRDGEATGRLAAAIRPSSPK